MPFAIGETIGPYRVTEQLGHGGMATVYRAYHANLDRYVALKVLHPALKTDATFAERFKREAQIVARLEHPNIVPVYDYSEHKGEPFLVMKFIEGQTLKGLLEHKALTLGEATRILFAVSSALDYAHDRDVLHRDIKPSNVLIDMNGEAFLADFGLARMASAGESTLSQDTLLGTPQYISPEQAQGVKDLDAATDIYSLGVVLYELLVGRVPYTADTPYAIIHNHIYSPLPMPSKVNPGVPLAVERVLLKALAKDRADRYTSATQLANALSDALTGIDPNLGLPFEGKTPASARATPNTIVQRQKAPKKDTPTPAPAITQGIPRRQGTALLIGLAALAAVVAIVVLVLAINANRVRQVIPTSAALVNTTVAPTWFATTPAPTQGTPIIAAPASITPVPTTMTPTAVPSQGSQNASATNGLTPRPTLTLRPTRTPARNMNVLSVLLESEARDYIAANPNDPLGYFALGIILSRDHARITDAERVFWQGYALVEDDPDLMLTLARRVSGVNLRGDNSLLKAVEMTLLAGVYAARAGEDDTVRETTGADLYRYAMETPNTGKTAGRTDILMKAAQSHKSAALYAFWALSAFRAGVPDTGKSALAKAAQMDGRMPEVNLIQGILYKENGKVVEAQRAFRLASGLDAPRWVREEARKLNRP